VSHPVITLISIKNIKNYVKALLDTDKVEIEKGEMIVDESVYQIPGQ
jgi:predicted transglutaminase-like protease